MNLYKKQIKNYWLEGTLLSCTLLIYFWYFPEVFLHPNSVLAGVTGDALKNYYTFSFHAVKDEGLLHFSGMNFPFGEHIVYTDCQPLISSLLRYFPFLHPVIIGVLHILLFSSYVITPLIIFRIFIKLSVTKSVSFFAALAITLLSPQFQKIAGGHHGLAYGCLIPLSILLNLNYDSNGSTKLFWILVLFNTCLFFIHPYMGFAASLFSFISLSLSALLKKEKKVKTFVIHLLVGCLPLISFQLFMLLTDEHPNRTTEPFGNNTLLENIDSLLAPDFGPFQPFLENIFSHKTQHLESHSYLGFFVIILAVICTVYCFVKLKKLKVDRFLTAALGASLLLLFISFGWHQKLLNRFGMHSQALNQFRAACRFAWTFYYLLPIFLFDLLARNLDGLFFKRMLPLLAASYLLLNLVESKYYFTKDRSNFWKYRNIFNEELLLQGERSAIKTLQKTNPQALVALPVFHIGSETFARPGGDASMIPAFFYSYHTGIPILGASLSRTSISETRASLSLLNGYLDQGSTIQYLKNKPFAILISKDELMPDEDRLIRNLKTIISNDSLSICFIDQKTFLAPKIKHPAIDLLVPRLSSSRSHLFISQAAQAPFSTCQLDDYQTIYKLSANELPSGIYVISYQIIPELLAPGHYPNLIIARREKENYFWERMYNGKTVSGFYESLLVFEFKAELHKESGYEFILKGTGEGKYHLRNFLVRPDTVDCYNRTNRRNEWNNFPISFSKQQDL